MGSSAISTYDLLMLVVLALATVFGLWKGMAWQVASLASLVASFVVAVRLSGPVAPYISAHEPWNRFLAMLVLYLITSAAIWLAFRLVAGIIDKIKLKTFDHQVGAVFGFFKGVLYCLVITFFAVSLSEPLRRVVSQSYSGRTIGRLIRETSPILPPELRKVLGVYLEELDRKLAPAGLAPERTTAPESEVPLTADRALTPWRLDRLEAPPTSGRLETPEPSPPPVPRPRWVAPPEERFDDQRPSEPETRYLPRWEQRKPRAEMPAFPEEF